MYIPTSFNSDFLPLEYCQHTQRALRILSERTISLQVPSTEHQKPLRNCHYDMMSGPPSSEVYRRVFLHASPAIALVT